MRRKFRDYLPTVHETAYIDPDSILIGQITVGKKASIWPGAVLRAEESQIEIQKGAAILDNTTIEAPKEYPVRVGKQALVSHAAVIHGGIVEPRSLVGINAVILEGARIGPEAIIGAGAVVTTGTVIPERKLALGIPAKVKRGVTSEDIESVRKEIKALEEKASEYKLDDS